MTDEPTAPAADAYRVILEDDGTLRTEPYDGPTEPLECGVEKFIREWRASVEEGAA